MSPQLHTWLYGIHQHDWMQALRSGGYRPTVFMQHGLMVGLWMGAASIVGLALWSSGALRRLWGIPLSLVVPILIATTLLSKSFGAIALLLVGALVLLLRPAGLRRDPRLGRVGRRGSGQPRARDQQRSRPLALRPARLRGEVAREGR
jgi:type IV secretory pathway VirB3-like protein